MNEKYNQSQIIFQIYSREKQFLGKFESVKIQLKGLAKYNFTLLQNNLYLNLNKDLWNLGKRMN